MMYPYGALLQHKQTGDVVSYVGNTPDPKTGRAEKMHANEAPDGWITYSCAGWIIEIVLTDYAPLYEERWA